MTLRRIGRFARLRAGLIGCCVAIAALAVASCSQPAAIQAGSPGKTAVVSARPAGTAGRTSGESAGVRRHSGHRGVVRSRVAAVRDSFAACEQRIGQGPRGIRAMAIVGASYTAGEGPGSPSLSWAADLAAKLRWNAVIYGVPGAGYVRAGAHGLGPMARMLEVQRLPGLDPSLVIVQAGHDDEGVPPRVERRQVLQAIDLIRVEAPRARIALVTVFSTPSAPVAPALYRLDHVIVTAARDADPRVIIMDPLTGHWTFPHAHDGLHPTTAGDAWIARKVASILRAQGIAASPSTVTSAVICDLSVPAKAVLSRSVTALVPRQRSAGPVDRRLPLGPAP